MCTMSGSCRFDEILRKVVSMLTVLLRNDLCPMDPSECTSLSQTCALLILILPCVTVIIFAFHLHLNFYLAH